AYTHYDGLLLVALGVVPLALLTPWRELPNRLRPFAAIVVLVLPWALFARRIFLAYRGWAEIVPPLVALRQSAIVYSVGEGASGDARRLALLVLPCLALVGLAELAVGRRWRPAAVLLGLAILPFVVVIVGSATGRPLYQERYLIVVTPAYFALAGLGVAFVSRWLVARMLVWAALIALGAISLSACFWPASPQKPDFRA